jgi:hypothetical protein
MLSENRIPQPKVVAYPYQRKPVIVKGEEDVADDKMLFQRTTALDDNQKRVHSAPQPASSLFNGDMQFVKPVREIKSFEKDSNGFNEGLGEMDLENNLSTQGQELYFEEGQDIGNGKHGYITDLNIFDQSTFIDFQDRHSPIPPWSELGVLEGEDDEDIPTFDDDLNWLLTAKDHDFKNYYQSSFQDTKDVLLNQISNNNNLNRNSVSPSPLRESKGPSPVARPVDEDNHQEKLPSPAVSDIVKDLTVETADPEKTRKVISPKDGKVSPKPGSPKYQKFYSWNDYQPSSKTPSPPSRSRSPAVHSKPTSAEEKAKQQQNQRNEKQTQEIAKEPTDKSKAKKEKPNKENDQQTLLLSKSMPVFPSRESVVTSGVSLEGGASSAAETNRRSLKGLTHEVFEGNSTDSPYVEHLVKPNKALQILRDTKTMNRSDMKGINLTPSSAKNSRKKQPLPNAKNYMIIKEPNDRIANKLLITNPADLQAGTMGRKGAMDKTKFPPIKSNAKFNSNSLLEMVYERPDDLYVKSKLMAEQISSNRSQARLSNKQGVSILPLQRGLSPDHDRTTKNLFEHNHGINFMNTRPISPEIIRSVSPSNNHFLGDSQMDTSKFTNNIDSLLMTMKTSSKPPTAVSSPQGGGVGAMTSFFQSMDKSSFLDASAMTLNDQDALEEAVEMLNSIHIDPLYRIIRDEIETIKAQQEQSAAMAASAAVVPMMNTTNTSSSRVNSRSGHRGGNAQVALQPLAVTNASINPSNIKVLSNFQSLPPSAWALCRITYFLVMAYYETIAMRPDYLEYRRVSQMESLWLILERHYNEENLNTSTINKIFSWPYLQELMAQPALFTKLLECVENGVQLAPNQWKLFQDNVKKRIYQVRKSQLMPPNALDRFKKLRGSNGGGGSGEEVPHSQTPSPAVEGESNNNQGVGIAFPHTLLSSGGDPSSSSSIPAESLTNNEQSRNLFYDLFPIPALHPLRELVSSAKIFLMGTTSSLYHHDHSTPGTSHPGVPGTPLAVTVTLTSWIKRVIALIYISTTQRLKEGRGIAGNSSSLVNNNNSIMNESQEMQLQSVEGSPTIITPGTGGGARRAITPTMTTTPGVLATNPKFLHTTHFSDRISSLLILHQPPASQHQRVGGSSNPFSGQRKAIAFDGNDVLLKGVPAYFQISTGLVKPSDDFNVLIMKPVSQNQTNKPPYQQQQQQSLDNNNDEFQNLLKEIQKHLRTTSGSPLHTVQILPMENYYLLKQKVYTNNNNNSDLNENNLDIHNKSELIDKCFILHDGLLYCLQINDLVFQKYMFFHPEDDQSVGSQAHQLFLQKQLQKNPHAHQLTLAPNISTALNEKFVDLFLTEFKIGQKNHPFMKLRKYTTLSDDIYSLAEKALKEKFTFSVGLISDSMMTRTTSGQATSTTGMKCSHYAVCINDTRNSWNGFEMARKLAKENDQIYLVYIPMISFWELYEEEFSQQQQQAQQQEEEANNPFSSVLPTPSTHKLLSNRFVTKSSLPYQQYLLLVQRIEQKIERLQATYRSYGYNIILGEIPDYLEVTQRIMNNYSVMMRYNTELFEQEQQLLQLRQQQQEQGQLQGQSVEENKIADDGRLPFEK